MHDLHDEDLKARLKTEYELKWAKEEAERKAKAEAAEEREKQIVAEYEAKKAKQAVEAKERERALLDKIEREKREKEAKEKEEYEEFLMKQKEKEEKKKREAKEAEEKLEQAMRERLLSHGYPLAQVERMIKKEKNEGTALVVAGGRDIITDTTITTWNGGRTPVYAKVHRDYLEIQTLREYGIPYEFDRVSYTSPTFPLFPSNTDHNVRCRKIQTTSSSYKRSTSTAPRSYSSTPVV